MPGRIIIQSGINYPASHAASDDIEVQSSDEDRKDPVGKVKRDLENSKGFDDDRQSERKPLFGPYNTAVMVILLVIVLMVLAFLLSRISAPSATLTIIVADPSGNDVEDAQVSVEGENGFAANVITDSDGRAIVSNAPLYTPLTVNASKGSYSAQRQLSIDSDSSVKLAFSSPPLKRKRITISVQTQDGEAVQQAALTYKYPNGTTYLMQETNAAGQATMVNDGIANSLTLTVWAFGLQPIKELPFDFSKTTLEVTLVPFNDSEYDLSVTETATPEPAITPLPYRGFVSPTPFRKTNCPADWVSSGGYCFLYQDSPASFDQAGSNCAAKSAKVATSAKVGLLDCDGMSCIDWYADSYVRLRVNWTNPNSEWLPGDAKFCIWDDDPAPGEQPSTGAYARCSLYCAFNITITDVYLNEKYYSGRSELGDYVCERSFRYVCMKPAT